jgi:hypothetical protein
VVDYRGQAVSALNKLRGCPKFRGTSAAVR